jgi:Tol biopolymer transport system component
LVNGGAPLGWSLTGDQIAFGCSTSPDICLLTIDTGKAETITANLPNNPPGSYAGNRFAGWSADGQKIEILFYIPQSTVYCLPFRLDEQSERIQRAPETKE